MVQFYYEGPVMHFDKCLTPKWVGSTYAVSESKARNNLVYQYKKTNNFAPSAKITLPGDVVTINQKEAAINGLRFELV